MNRYLVVAVMAACTVSNSYAWNCSGLKDVGGVNFQICTNGREGQMGIRYRNNNSYAVTLDFGSCNIQFGDGALERSGGWSEINLRPGTGGLQFINYPETRGRSYHIRCDDVDVGQR